MIRQFTCIPFDTLDFLIPCENIVSGLYHQLAENTFRIPFNQETLPHLSLTRPIETEFKCRHRTEATVAVIVQNHGFPRDVCERLVAYTNTAFPASGCLAISFQADIHSLFLDTREIHLFGGSIKENMISNGLPAVRFCESNRYQFLLSPDLLMRRFFLRGHL